MLPTVFVATPLRDGRMHEQYFAGALSATRAYGDRIQFGTATGALPRARDGLTKRFLESGRSHMLCLDSDIGWEVEDLDRLLETKLDCVSGCYALKDGSGQVPWHRRSEGGSIGELVEATYVPGGFMLVSRDAVERMIRRYPDLTYQGPLGTTSALWMPIFETGGAYLSEDISFCRRYRATGDRIWLHRGVTLEHVGDQVFTPHREALL